MFFPDGRVMKEMGCVWIFRQDLSDVWVSATTNASSALAHGTVAFKRSAQVTAMSRSHSSIIKKMECPPFLEFEPVKIAMDVRSGGMVLVPEDVHFPAIAVSAGQVATCNLLQNVCNMQRLQGRYFRHVSAIPVPQLLDERRKGKVPLARADRQKERWITVLPYGIYKIQILMLPEGAGKSCSQGFCSASSQIASMN